MRRLTLLLLLVGLAGCGDDAAPTTTAAAPPPNRQVEPRRPALPDDLEVSFAGEGARGSWIIRREGGEDDPVLLFLHGWTAVDPATYAGWIAHLARKGSTVVYPVYQDAPFLAPAVAFDGVVAGVRAALDAEDPSREGWVVAGHSAGGAMSADYAARASELGLPPARAVFSVYPGRQIARIPLKLPEADPARIPPATRLVALYGTNDQTVGDVTAKRTIDAAGMGELVRVDDPDVNVHLAPLLVTEEAKATFWAPLDELVEGVRD